MIRQNSIDAYHEIKDNGLLSEKRMEVYEALFYHGPCTGMELLQHMPPSSVDSQVRARLGELRDLKVAFEVGERKCGVTGMNVIVWDVTDQLPVQIEKEKKSNVAEIYKVALKQIETMGGMQGFIATEALRKGRL